MQFTTVGTEGDDVVGTEEIEDDEVVEVAAACVCAVAVFVVCTCAAVFFFRTNFFFGCLGSDSSWYSLNESGLTSRSGVLFKKYEPDSAPNDASTNGSLRADPKRPSSNVRKGNDIK